MAHLYLSAAHKSSGKTTLSIGLCRALQHQGLYVQPFKKGPDYIDPIWLTQSAGHPCYNLDFNTQSHAEICELFARKMQGADIGLIEGNKGLFDGMDLHGSDSNAAMAKHLDAPVVLVLDTRGTIRGVAPLLLGYQNFDHDLHIGGVILNMVGGSRHEAKLRAVIDEYTDIPVIGAVHRSNEMQILERHLGLVPGNEHGEAEAHIEVLAELIAKQVDLPQLISVAEQAPDNLPAVPSTVEVVPATVKIGIARDESFGFYYPDDLEALQAAGAELVFFNTLSDGELPGVDGLFIGGGFPETHLQQLTANSSLRQAIRDAIEAGLPAYTECGGLMYMCRSIIWNEQSSEMVGIIEADAVMRNRPQGRGYIRLRPTDGFPWSDADSQGVINGHEFHYSALENFGREYEYAYEVIRGSGINGQYDGLRYKNLLACYAHLRDTEQFHWARQFVQFVRQHKSRS